MPRQAPKRSRPNLKDGPADRNDDRATDRTTARARELAVALHELAWLLPRTLDVLVERRLADPLPSTELEIMRLLVRQPGLTVTDVARELALQTSNASTAIRTLVARNLLERRPDRIDGRVVRLHPTELAIAIRRRRERAWGEALAERLELLDDDVTQRLLNAGPALRVLAEELAGT